MKYLWNMSIQEDEVEFRYTEHTPEKEARGIGLSFNANKSYDSDDKEIKPIVDAAKQMCNILKLDITKNNLLLMRSFERFIVIYGCGVFEAKLKNDLVVIGTENGRLFTREQLNAIFDFVDVLIKYNWFF